MVAGLFANTMWIAHLNGIDRRVLDPLQYPGALATQGRPVAIVGHSHADTYVEPLHLLGLEHGFRVVPGAEDFWAELAERGIPFLGLRDNPRLVTAEGEPFYPNRCMNRVDHWSECAVPRERMYDADNPADPILAQWDTARSVDTSNWFCPNGWCQPVIGNVVVYRDRDHMTNAYARSLAPMLWEHLERHLADTGAGARRAG